MGDFIKLTASLTCITLLAGLALAVTNRRTAEKIAMQKRLEIRSSLEAVFPAGVSVTRQQGETPLPGVYWKAAVDSGTVGYAFRIRAQGYGGPIACIAGVTPEGTILGLSVLSHTETPGLGDRMLEAPSDRSIWNAWYTEETPRMPWFTRQFAGLDCTGPISIEKSREWHLLEETDRERLRRENTVTAITGATITTAAVVSALNGAISPRLEAIPRTENLHDY